MSDSSTVEGGTAAADATLPVDGEPSTPTAVAQDPLVAYRTGEDPGPYLDALAGADDDALAPVRTDRATGLAFWLNLYNAGTQRLLRDEEDRYGSRLRQFRFFSADCLTVAGTGLSLDEIEHDILRRGRSKYGLGYLPRVRSSAFARRYRLDPDPRIHFALNCGAASCPAIRAYDPVRIDEQLDLATRAYLDDTVEFDPDSGTVRVPRVFLWFRGDFGGGAGIRAFLSEYDAYPEGARRVRYRSWDWTRAEGNFVD